MEFIKQDRYILKLIDHTTNKTYNIRKSHNLYELIQDKDRICHNNFLINSEVVIYKLYDDYGRLCNEFVRPLYNGYVKLSNDDIIFNQSMIEIIIETFK